MSSQSEEELVALLASEQRGSRRILMFGIVVLVVMALTSVALGAFYFFMSQRLEATARELQQKSFATTRAIDSQNNKISDQENTLRLEFEDIRRVAGVRTGAVTPQARAAAIAAAADYLRAGRRIALGDEIVLDSLAGDEPATPEGELARGATDLLEYDRSSESSRDEGSAKLSPRLQDAVTAFAAASAAATSDTKQAALAGVALVRFQAATNARYALPACQALFDAIAAAQAAGSPGPQPLYARAQCERKLGRTPDALAHYAEALRDAVDAQAQAEASNQELDQGELAIGMNAYHGVGTTLISGFDLPDANPQVRSAVAVATAACPVDADTAKLSARVRLAVSCLRKAIALRRQMHQTANQESFTGENLSFAYLRDGDFHSAYANANSVAEKGLFAWNELALALSAKHVHRDDESALRNLSFFQPAQFNVCELQTLLSAPLYKEALGILSETHRGRKVSCPAAGGR